MIHGHGQTLAADAHFGSALPTCEQALRLVVGELHQREMVGAGGRAFKTQRLVDNLIQVGGLIYKTHP